jgi:hypothetical protein
MADAGADYFVGQFSFGDLPCAETLRSIDLFAQQVMPKLRNGRGRFDRGDAPRAQHSA